MRAGLGMAHGEVGSSSSVLTYSRGCPAHLWGAPQRPPALRVTPQIPTAPETPEQQASSMSLCCDQSVGSHQSPSSEAVPFPASPRAIPAEKCCARGAARGPGEVPAARRSAPARSPSGRQAGGRIHSTSGLASNPARRLVGAQLGWSILATGSITPHTWVWCL